MTVRKGFMLCPTGRGLAATRRPFGDAHLPVWHSTRTRISSHYQTTQHKNKVSTLSGDLTNEIITDTVYKGTYNFVNPGTADDGWIEYSERFVGHGVLDVIPYFIMGN